MDGCVGDDNVDGILDPFPTITGTPTLTLNPTTTTTATATAFDSTTSPTAAVDDGRDCQRDTGIR